MKRPTRKSASLANYKLGSLHRLEYSSVQDGKFRLVPCDGYVRITAFSPWNTEIMIPRRRFNRIVKAYLKEQKFVRK